MHPYNCHPQLGDLPELRCTGSTGSPGPKQVHCKLNEKVIGVTRKIILKRLKHLD